MDQKFGVMAVVVVVAMLCSLSLVFAVESEATYRIPPYTPSECFNSTDKGTLIAAVGQSIWNNKRICGQKLNVRCIHDSQSCKNSSVTVEVVDLCLGCNDSIVLSDEAFDIIANLEVGRVTVDYELVYG